MHIGLVVGETSGDILGADLIASLRTKFPDARFSGIGGPRMIETGFQSYFDMERLAVMGIWEPLKRLPELLKIRKSVGDKFVSDKVDHFVGIDAPDFNLDLEIRLKNSDIPVVHYVSPSVWAWRQGRIKKIARAVDLMLTLFPFEADFYQQSGVPVRFVGHPLADTFSERCDQEGARENLGIDSRQLVIALLPGSRRSEVALLARIFVGGAEVINNQRPNTKFIFSAANKDRYDQIREATKESSLDFDVRLGDSRTVMAAADMVVLASGTATLEAMLLKKPMVMAYRMGRISYALIRPLIKTKYIALPNLLANEPLVNELIQSDATPEKIADAVTLLEKDEDAKSMLLDRFDEIHIELQRNASEQAAASIFDLLEARRAI